MSSIEIDVSANIAKFKSAMDKAAKEGKNLNSRLNKSFNSINKAMKGLGALAGVAVGGGLVSLGKRAIDTADNIEKLGRRTGATAEFLSEMRLSLSQNAVSQGEFETALRKINKSSQDASDGLSTQVRAFDKLGISVDGFQKLNSDDKFIALSEAISRVEDPAVKTQVAMDIMGRSGAQLLTVMEGGAAGIASYREEAVKLGQSLSQDQVNAAAAANDALDKLSKSISGGFNKTIVQYSSEIKRAADFTREYFPKAIEFLIDIFRGLKAVVQAVVVTILDHFEALFKAAEKMPLVGENFKGVANFFEDASYSIQEDLKANIGEMGKWRKETDALSADSKAMADRINATSVPAFKVLGKTVDISTKITKENAKETVKLTSTYKSAATRVKELAKSFNDSIRIFGQYDSALEEVNSVILDGIKADQRAIAIKKELFEQLEKGVITNEQYQKALETTGLKTEEVEKVSGAAITVIADSWGRFKDLAFDSLSQFWKGSLDGTKDFGESMKDVFKDMVSGILTQITALIASNAFQKFLSFVSGGKYGSDKGIFDGLGQLFGGGSSNGSGGQSLAGLFGQGSNASTTLGAANDAYGIYGNVQGVQAGLEQGGTEGYTSAAISAAGAYRNAASIVKWYQSLSSTSAAVGQGSVANLANMGVGSTTGTGVSTGVIAEAPATSAASGSGLGVAGTIAGWAALAIAFDQLFLDGKGGEEGVKIWEQRRDDLKSGGPLKGAIRDLSGQNLHNYIQGMFGGRSTDELGGDQLRDVLGNLESGAIQALGLTDKTTFLGGFNEETTFFQTDSEADKGRISELIQSRLGFGDVREISDGILRLEGQGTKFSEMSDEIISNVLASIAEVEIGFTKLERESVKSMGDAFIEMDKIFDASADSGMEAQERVLEAIKETYGKSTEEAEKWLSDSGLTAERFEQAFTSASGNVLSDVINTFESTEDSAKDAFAAVSESARDNFRLIQGGLSEVTRSAQSEAQVISESFNNLTSGINSNISTISQNTNQLTRSVDQLARDQSALIRDNKRTKAATNAA